MWYQLDDVDLLSHAVAGPFNFVNNHRVPEDIWKELVAEAEEQDIYVGNLNQTIPLDHVDRQDEGTSFLAMKWTLDSSFYME